MFGKFFCIIVIYFWGLYQIHGNVWEMCQDFWHDNYSGAPDDGSVWEGGDERIVCRGGSWFNYGKNIRSACRDYWLFAGDYDGFRLALDPVGNGHGRGEKETFLFFLQLLRSKVLIV